MSNKPLNVGKLAKAVTITHPLEMVGFIKSIGTQCQFVSLLTETEPKLRAACPYKGVRKVSRRNGLINMNFNTAVRKRVAEKLGLSIGQVEYTNGEVWFRHEVATDGTPLPLVVNKKKNDGKFYLQYFPLRSHSRYFMPNGEEIPEAKLQPYFYAKSESDFKPVTCVFGIDNVKQMKAAKVIMQTGEAEEVNQVLVNG